MQFSETSQPKTYTSECGTSIPIIQINAYDYELEKAESKTKSLPLLPSHRYQYTIWHELRGSTHVKGDQLHAPRVREGPADKENTFHTLTDEQGELIHHDKSDKQRVKHRNETENWEAAKHVNLSYQKLNQSYQRKNFRRILQRLYCAEEIILMDDNLHDLSDIKFPRCHTINLTRNYFSSFKQLPKMPQLRHLILSENQISDERGLSQFPNLVTLEMFGNGLTFSPSYRQRIFKILPNLKSLDKTLRLTSDYEVSAYEQDQAQTCTIL